MKNCDASYFLNVHNMQNGDKAPILTNSHHEKYLKIFQYSNLYSLLLTNGSLKTCYLESGFVECQFQCCYPPPVQFPLTFLGKQLRSAQVLRFLPYGSPAPGSAWLWRMNQSIEGLSLCLPNNLINLLWKKKDCYLKMGTSWTQFYFPQDCAVFTDRNTAHVLWICIFLRTALCCFCKFTSILVNRELPDIQWQILRPLMYIKKCYLELSLLLSFSKQNTLRPEH